MVIVIIWQRIKKMETGGMVNGAISRAMRLDF